MIAFFVSLLRETFPPKPTFTVQDIPDLSGRVIIVTGANTGVGKETAKALLAHNAKVYFASRSKDKTEQAIQDLKDETGNEGLLLQLDLSDLKSVKAAAEDFLSKEKELHILFNNAGVMEPPVSEVTTQGYDLQFGTNVLGHFYLTKLLLPALIEGAKASSDGKARVVTTSSSRSLFGKIDFNTFKDGPARRRESPGALYSQSKLGNVLFANELARRHEKDGIVSVSLNPGNLRTELQRHMSWFSRHSRLLIQYPVPYGALTQLWVGTSEVGKEFNGKYLVPWARLGKPNPLAEDHQLAEDLWKWCEDQVSNLS
ncbi:NAD(P)-binding protein [Coprinopsis marcescibilis]|uniref:NAD(P)-binding protein n=1 Tax=Coprinopsis marcescibilis TaxID=230819 RepID=A0A5C3L7D3_COPMA|nr:NAD(P)-binding protein [Coprinopsis marcescibilis]